MADDPSRLEQAAGSYSVPCPLLDGTNGTGATMGQALASLVYHMRDAHTTNLPEPVRSQVKDKMTGCAHTLGGLPV